MKEAAKLRSLGELYIQRTCSDFPQWGSSSGFSSFEGRLAGSDVKTRSERNAFLEELLAETEALPGNALKGDDWLDRRCFLSLLRTELLNSRDIERWRTNPQECCDIAVGAIFELVIRYSDDLSKARQVIESRLTAIPHFLKKGAEAIRFPIPLWTKLAERSARSAKIFVDTLGVTLATLSTDPAGKRRSIDLARRAASAFDDYAVAISKIKSGKRGGFSLGRERFEFLVRERCGLDWSLEEIEAVGYRLITKLSAELENEARKYGRKSAKLILEGARDAWNPAESLMDLYTRSSQQWKNRVIECGLYPFPSGQSLKVMPVPDFMREHFPIAAYSSPGAFERRQRGIFWVNDLGSTKHTPTAALREKRQHFGFELTCAHEGYPGHHLQFSIQNRHPSRIRRLCSHSIFYEGWTMWCEKMAVEQKWVTEPYARLQQLHDALWRAWRIVIDVGLHSGNLTHEQAAQMLVKGVGFTTARARTDVNWYTSQPSVPMSYLLGRLELERIKSRLVDKEGWSLRKFHDWVLSHGAVPWNWIWQARLHERA